MWLLLLGAVLASGTANGQLVLNEVLPSNYRSSPDPGGEYEDYIELYNAGPTGVDLSGYGVSDRRDEPYRYRAPSFVLNPGLHFTIRAAGISPPVNNTSAEFKLSSGGETVYLTSPTGELVDSIAFPALRADVAYARAGDGGATWGLTDRPTIGSANPTELATGFAPAVRIDGTRGDLAIAVAEEGGAAPTLRFTVDGSEPTEQSPSWPADLPAAGPLVLRARAFGPGLLPGVTATRTFLPEASTTLPVVALATAPDGLFDPETGIWVPGPNAQPEYPFFGANFYNNTELPCNFELFEESAAATTGQADFSDVAGMRVFGNFSRALVQKSSAVTARESFGSRGEAFDHDFFPGWPNRGGDMRGLVLRNGGNDFARAQLRDGFAATLARHTDNEVMAYRPIVTYVNGAYWGLQGLRERPNEHTAARRAGVDVEEIDLIENRGNIDPLDNLPDNGTLDAYRDLLAFFDRTDFSAPAAYDSLAARFALDNFLDYYATEVYVANEDWPGNNNRIYRVRRPGERWRYLLYDLDVAFGYDRASSAYDPIALERLLDPVGADFPNPPQATRFFRSAMANARMRAAFGTRVADLLNFDYRPAVALATLDSLADLIAPEVPRHRERWEPAGGWVSWTAQLDTIRNFLNVRPRSLRAALRGQLGFGAETDVDLAIEGPVGSGTIWVNDYRRVATTSWSGVYFAGTPVTLTAEPLPGYVFVRWDGLPAGTLSTTPTITFDPAVPAGAVTAVFAVDPRPLAGVYINELNYRSPAEGDAGDWIELHNPTAEDVPLTGFTLDDGDPLDAYAFPDGASLTAGGYVVVARNPADFTAVHPNVGLLAGELPFGLSGDGDVAVLRDATGRVVDSVRYQTISPWPTSPNGEGPTLELRPDADDDPLSRERPANWQASYVPGGTPGARNSTKSSATRDAGAGVQLAAWPVPTRDRLWVGLPDELGEGPLSLGLYDYAGRAVLRQQLASRPTQGLSLSVRGLTPGVYALVLERDGAQLGRTRVLVGGAE